MITCKQGARRFKEFKNSLYCVRGVKVYYKTNTRIARIVEGKKASEAGIAIVAWMIVQLD